jgi:hypothetical protein
LKFEIHSDLPELNRADGRRAISGFVAPARNFSGTENSCRDMSCKLATKIYLEICSQKRQAYANP